MTSVAMVSDGGAPGERHERGSQVSRFFAVLRRGRTYGNLAYLLLGLLLGWAYIGAFGNLWWALFGSISVLAIPVFLFVCPWLVAYFERWLARWLLGVSFTPMAPPLPPSVTLWERAKAHLRNPVTWKSMVYLFVRVPLGFAAFVITAALLVVPLTLILAPAIYVVGVVNSGSEQAVFHTESLAAIVGSGGYQFGHALGLGSQITPAALVVSVLIAALGVVALVAALHAVNGLAAGWGMFAQALLGVSPKDLQLAEARAIAAEAHARAERAESGRRQLILDASHELRTPAATVRARIESLLLLEGEQLPEHLRAYLAVTQREAERLAALVDDLLMLARSDADELRLDVRPVAVGAVVEEVFGAIEPLAERERQVTLVREVAPDLPLAYADRDRLAQVLLNLTRNAITYTPAGGLVSIELAAGETPGTLALSVTDTGIGIPEEDLDHVFERFYRTDASRARHTGGFGLGLSSVRDLVEGMGGTVAVERVPAGGSRFRVTLRAVQGMTTAS